MNDYTVILILPENVASEYGECFTYFVTATNGDEAIWMAQVQAFTCCNESFETAKNDDPKAYIPVAVFKGHLEQESWG